MIGKQDTAAPQAKPDVSLPSDGVVDGGMLAKKVFAALVRNEPENLLSVLPSAKVIARAHLEGQSFSHPVRIPVTANLVLRRTTSWDDGVFKAACEEIAHGVPGEFRRARQLAEKKGIVWSAAVLDGYCWRHELLADDLEGPVKRAGWLVLRVRSAKVVVNVAIEAFLRGGEAFVADHFSVLDFTVEEKRYFEYANWGQAPTAEASKAAIVAALSLVKKHELSKYEVLETLGWLVDDYRSDRWTYDKLGARYPPCPLVVVVFGDAGTVSSVLLDGQPVP